jgi:hypothetical protein
MDGDGKNSLVIVCIPSHIINKVNKLTTLHAYNIANRIDLVHLYMLTNDTEKDYR